MVYCAVVGCRSRTQSKAQKLKTGQPDCGFFKITKIRLHECGKAKELSERRRREWLTRISRREIDANPEKYQVCARHFVSGQPSKLFDDCNPDCAPSLHLGYASRSPNQSHYHRRNARSHHQFSSAGARDEPTANEGTPMCNEEIEPAILSRADAVCQTDLGAADISGLEDQISDLRQLQASKEASRTTSFTEDSLQGCDDRVAFYTGLPTFVMLCSLFKLVKEHVSYSGKHKLTQFQEIMLFLMRMRLGCQYQDLAYHFCVSMSTASRICDKWLDVFFHRIEPLVHWPDKEQVMKTMPVDFVDNFGLKVRVILDCFKVFTDRPSSYLPRAETWSHYKHHNTVKFLLGASPQGAVTFLSKAYGGRESDKSITEECGVLDALEYGDVVLADRGFLISDSVGLCRATLAIPAFTKGKRQLSSNDIERTKEIANVRIHVERIIGMVRNKYTILKGSLPVEVLRQNKYGECQIDKIARVCCALTNLCNSVVPFD